MIIGAFLGDEANVILENQIWGQSIKRKILKYLTLGKWAKLT